MLCTLTCCFPFKCLPYMCSEQSLIHRGKVCRFVIIIKLLDLMVDWYIVVLLELTGTNPSVCEVSCMSTRV